MIALAWWCTVKSRYWATAGGGGGPPWARPEFEHHLAVQPIVSWCRLHIQLPSGIAQGNSWHVSCFKNRVLALCVVACEGVWFVVDYLDVMRCSCVDVRFGVFGVSGVVRCGSVGFGVVWWGVVWFGVVWRSFDVV